MERQCFACMFPIEGSLGSYFIAKIGPLLGFFLLDFFKAIFLGICFALSTAELISLSGYFLSNSIAFSSMSLLSLSWISVHVLIILRESEKGIYFWSLCLGEYLKVINIDFLPILF